MCDRMYKKELEGEGVLDVEKALQNQFPSWFKKEVSFFSPYLLSVFFHCTSAYQHVSYLLVQVARRKFIIGEEVNDGLYALACQPDLRVKVFSACLVGGIRFHTVDREKNRRTQNSGVMTEGTHNEEYVDFYGSVKDIIQLRYNSDSSCERTVVLFRCD
jgi:hypothetical protein